MGSSPEEPTASKEPAVVGSSVEEPAEKSAKNARFELLLSYILVTI